MEVLSAQFHRNVEIVDWSMTSKNDKYDTLKHQQKHCVIISDVKTLVQK